jgi:predicted RNA-binding Zn-ribbon protein involved in translation (DUF1610 family)
VTLKLDVKKQKAPDPKKRITQCPECASEWIEWKTGQHIRPHNYICQDCGYEGIVLLESDVD